MQVYEKLIKSSNHGEQMVEKRVNPRGRVPPPHPIHLLLQESTRKERIEETPSTYEHLFKCTSVMIYSLAH